jgi:hypothetical protein
VPIAGLRDSHSPPRNMLKTNVFGGSNEPARNRCELDAPVRAAGP